MVAQIPDEVAPLLLAPCRTGSASVPGEKRRGFVGDALLAEMPVKPLDMGEDQVRKLQVVLPPNTDLTGRFVIAFVDADDIVEESNEANNIVASPPID